jgi:PAS domain S-box-containing protein
MLPRLGRRTGRRSAFVYYKERTIWPLNLGWPMAFKPKMSSRVDQAADVGEWFLHNGLDAFVSLKGGVVATVNDTWERLTGFNRPRSVGRLYANFLFPEDVTTARADLERLPQGGKGVFTYRVAEKSGGWLWMRHHIAKMGDGAVLMILRDITRERQREMDSEQVTRVAAMVRTTAGVTTFRYDAELDLYEIDPDFTHHLDRSALEVRTGEAQRAMVHPDDYESAMSVWNRTLATGERAETEYRLKTPKRGRWRRVRGCWQGLRRRACGGWDIIGCTADITEIADARDVALKGEQAAKAATKAKSDFLANISHELRTPMNGVLGVLHLIKAEPPRRERQKLIEQGLSAGVGLSDLLNDIIDFSDVEAGRFVLSAEPVEPAEQLASIIAMFKPEAEAKGVDLTVKGAEGVGWVAADPARLRKVFFHLVSNAVKFTHHGHVEVRISASGEGEARRLALEVEDTGVGIAPEAEPKIFQQFSQADSSVTRRYAGPGLGLALTRSLAEQMGGGVGFVSEPGKGSTFRLEISAPAAAPPAAGVEEPTADWLQGVRVLVVEDNPTNRLVATKMLSQLGAEVTTAEDGAQGVAAVASADFDIIFMDIQMPVMDGVEATRRIRAMAPPKCRIPIVATTANVMPEQLSAYRESGINGVVAKPISPVALITEVARIAEAA